MRKIKSKNKKWPPKALHLKKDSSYLIPSLTYNVDKGDKVLIYIHGGSFAEKVCFHQLLFAKKIAKKTNSILLVPYYQLLPKGNCEMNLDNLLKYYEEISKDYEINLLGDSAGGNLAIALAMLVRDKKMKQPQNIIVMSPWLDISMSNKNIYEDSRKDKIIGVAGAKYLGKLWAKDIELNDYRVSPMFGNFKDIGKVTLIFGGEEIFTSDCELLIDKLKSEKIDYNSICFTKQGHDFGAYPTIERTATINLIERILNENNS